eukprot:6174922-Pleurochrysis_carterae.AAC.2
MRDQGGVALRRKTGRRTDKVAQECRFEESMSHLHFLDAVHEQRRPWLMHAQARAAARFGGGRRALERGAVESAGTLPLRVATSVAVAAAASRNARASVEPSARSSAAAIHGGVDTLGLPLRVPALGEALKEAALALLLTSNAHRSGVLRKRVCNARQSRYVPGCSKGKHHAQVSQSSLEEPSARHQCARDTHG